MKRKYTLPVELLFIFVLICSFISFLLIAPVIQVLNRAPLQSKVATDWTYMVYVDADNNLDSYGVDDINEMETGYIDSASSDVNVIVFIDREYSGAKTYKISHDSSPSVITSSILTTGFPSEPNMGSKATLKNFITYVFNNFPADKYVLDLWDHGGGIFGICWDDSSGNDKLSFDEVDEAIGEACSAAGEIIDILAMDACLMHMLEVDYEMREYVNYIVASEETIPGSGYPYNDMINRLCNNPTQSAATYASAMVDDYHTSYSISYDTTLSAVDVTTSSITALMGAFNEFVTQLRAQIGAGRSSQIASARAATQEFYYDFFVDLYDFAEEAYSRISDSTFQTAANQLMQNISNAVLNSKQHNNPDAHGISIYFPDNADDYDSGYETVIDLGQETDWDLFLNEFYYGPSYEVSLQTYTFDDPSGYPGNDADNIIDQGETINLTVTLKNTGSEIANNVNGTLSTSEGNITILVGFQDYGTLNVGAALALDFQFNVSQTAQNGLLLNFNFLIQAMFNSTYARNESILLIVNVSTIIGGNSFETAVEITEGIHNSLMPGLDPTDLSAWFKINVSQNKFLTTTIILGPSSTDFDVYLYSPSGALIGIGALATYPDPCSALARETGYYRIRVTPYSGSGLYTFNVTISTSPGPEDGLGFGTAITLWANSPTATGSCPAASSTGYMYFRIFLEAGEAVRIFLRGTSGTHDFDLYLLSSNLDTVASATSYRYPEQLNFRATEEGVYYLLVVPYSGSGGFEIEVEFLAPFNLPDWVIMLIIIIVVIVVIVGICLFFKMR
ncbi:MAG: clostripain-related cysteine peptidase [Candidatus Helarchaeota archaeon]